MKRILAIIGFVFCGLSAFGQGYPVNQSIGADSALVTSKGGFKGKLINWNFADTATANLHPIRTYAGAMIFVHNAIYFRDSSVTRWVQLIPNGGASASDTMYWKLGGNNLSAFGGLPAMGTSSYNDFNYITNNLKRFSLSKDGIIANNVHVVNLGIDTAQGYLAYGSSGGSGGSSVDSLTRTIGVDSFYWWKLGVKHALLDSSGGSGWSLTGNAISGTEFIGTTNVHDLIFKRNNVEGLRVVNREIDVTNIYLPINTNDSTGIIYKTHSGFGKVPFLYNFEKPGTNGDNLFLGLLAGNPNLINAGTGTLTATIGGAGPGDEGSYNTGIGSAALYSLTQGFRNTAVGTYALQNNTTGWINTAVGMESMFSNTTGRGNTAIGVRSLDRNNGDGNTASGVDALWGNTTGGFNTGVGIDALYQNTTGKYNTAVGDSTAWINTVGVKNTIIGSRSGYYLGDTYPNFASVKDSFCTFLGANTSRDSSISNTTALNNLTLIGYNTRGFASNQVVLGNNDVTTTLLKGKVGISTTTPDSSFHVVGGLKFVTGRQGSGKVLTSDANGGADWATVSTPTLQQVTGVDSVTTHQIGLGSTTHPAAFIHYGIPEGVWGSILQPTNYGTSYPFLPPYVGAKITRADRFYAYGYSNNDSANSVYDRRPNVVGIPWGYNVDVSGNRKDTSDGAFVFKTETHYYINGFHPSFEFHIPQMTLYDGTDTRINSIYADKITGLAIQEKRIRSEEWFSLQSGAPGVGVAFASLTDNTSGGVYGEFTLYGEPASNRAGKIYFRQNGYNTSIEGVNGSLGLFSGGDQKLHVTSNGAYVDGLATGLTPPTTTGTIKMVISDQNGLLSFTSIPAGTVTSVATNTGSGITGGTITGSGTIAADTASVLATKYYSKHYADSIKTTISSGLIVGTTTVTSGTDQYFLYNNAGTLANLGSTGTGNVMRAASPTTTGTINGAAAIFSGLIQSTANNGFNITASGVGAAYMSIYSGDGQTSYFGKNSSTGGAFGGAAWSTIIGNGSSTAPVQIMPGLADAVRVYQTGMSVMTAAANNSALQTTSFATAYVAKTANYTATISDYTIDCTSNTFTVTLPTAVGITGRHYVVVNSGAGIITIGTTSSQTFTNVVASPTTLTLSAVGTYIVQSTGSNWIVLSTN